MSRWISVDPILEEYLPISNSGKNNKLPGHGGIYNYDNLNLYHYGGNNPVKYVDPDGNEKKEYSIVKLENGIKYLANKYNGKNVYMLYGFSKKNTVSGNGLSQEQALEGFSQIKSKMHEVAKKIASKGYNVIVLNSISKSDVKKALSDKRAYGVIVSTHGDHIRGFALSNGKAFHPRDINKVNKNLNFLFNMACYQGHGNLRNRYEKRLPKKTNYLASPGRVKTYEQNYYLNKIENYLTKKANAPP